MELFTLDPGLAIWTWISFGILFFILWKYLLPPLMGSIKKRELFIAESVDNADEIKKRLLDIRAEQSDILEKAKQEADRIISNSRKDAETVKKKLLLDAEKEAETVVSQAIIRAAEEREILMQAIQKEIGIFVCEASEKIIGTSFTGEKERILAEKMAESL